MEDRRTGRGRRRDDPPPETIVVPLSDIIGSLERTGSKAPVRTARKAEPSQSGQKLGRVTLVFSCKGGAGSTLLAVNVAHYYARANRATCLLDLDLQLGDALAALCLQPKIYLADAIGMVNEGDACTPAQLSRHESGICVLSQVGALDNMGDVNAESTSRLIAHLREQFAHVVIDGVNDFSEIALAGIDAADKIVIVTTQEVLAVRRARWVFDVLARLGIEAHDITVAVNRFDTTSRLTLARLEEMFKPSAVVAVRSDAVTAGKSLDRGVPVHAIAAGAGLTGDIARLSGLLADEIPYRAGVIPVEEQRSFLGGLLRKKP